MPKCQLKVIESIEKTWSQILTDALVEIRPSPESPEIDFYHRNPTWRDCVTLMASLPDSLLTYSDTQYLYDADLNNYEQRMKVVELVVKHEALLIEKDLPTYIRYGESY